MYMSYVLYYPAFFPGQMLLSMNSLTHFTPTQCPATPDLLFGWQWESLGGGPGFCLRWSNNTREWHVHVGGFNPSEKYEFVSWDDKIPNIWKNNQHVPNHQPACMLFLMLLVSWAYQFYRKGTKKRVLEPSTKHKIYEPFWLIFGFAETGFGTPKNQEIDFANPIQVPGLVVTHIANWKIPTINGSL